MEGGKCIEEGEADILVTEKIMLFVAISGGVL